MTKDEKATYKLISSTLYEKTMEKLRNRINVKLVNNKKDYLKCTTKPSYMSHKMFDNNLAAIRKSKITLTLNKPVYIGMSTLDLSIVLMYELHYDYIKNKYDNNSRLLFTNIDSLMYEIKTEDFSHDKQIFDFSNYSAKSKFYDNSNELVITKMKDETGCVSIKEFVRLKPRMYPYLVDNSQHKKAKDVNNNFVEIISQNEYKDIC